MDLHVLLLVLFAAVLHAGWNALVKAGNDKLVMQALIIFGSSLPAMFAVPFLPLPDPTSWPFLAASVTIHAVYYCTLTYAYEHGDLSQVYPIARGSSPAMVAVVAWILAGESLTLLEGAGIALLSIGIISLARPHGADGKRAIWWAMATGITIAAYTIADGLGGRSTENVWSYVAWLFVLEAQVVIWFALWRRRGRIRTALAPVWKKGLIGGLCAGVSYGIAIWAMTLAPLAHVVALRETSVIAATVIGTLLLGESFGSRRITAAILVACGAGLLRIAG
ncbi:EamA family transporter [Pelagibius sp. Alg239-R121]|uniref:EamA family transporter n=1 Tax=Pelagibius sp. Alg239-R121 TaxID=2993448 RepID=UPI0024A77BC2|nr:EamA family transporter [Pelagibius sp. Alg239-R121]